MIEQQPGAGEVLVRTIINFPKYLVEWTLGLIVAILSDLHITTLAVTAVAIGFYLHSVLAGVAAFFVLYSLSRIVANIANAIGTGLQGLYIAQRDANAIAANPQRVIESSPEA